MFANVCTACGERQLIFPSQITSLTSTEHGFAVGYTCWCGAEQTWISVRDAALAA